MERIRAVGLNSLSKYPNYYGLGIVLGNGEVTMWELAHAYLVLARGGTQIPLKIQSKNQETQSTIVLDERIVYLINDVLSDNNARDLSFGLNSPLSQSFPAAVKTGTSTNYRDNWTIGHTPDYLVAVWVGNFDGSPMQNVSGVSGAGPIWHRVMKEVVGSRKSEFTPTDDVFSRVICSDSHMLLGTHCLATMTEVFTSDMLNSQRVCTPKEHVHSAIKKYEQNREPVNDFIEIVFPSHNTYFAIDPNISRERQILKIDYVAKYGVDDVRVFVDDIELDVFEWQLTKGNHKIDIRGHIKNGLVKDTVYITVF